MRWLLKYPITADEVNQQLAEIQIHVGPDSPCGDIGPMIRQGIQEFFQSEDNMAKLLEHLRIK